MSEKDHPILQRPNRSMSGAKEWDQGVPEVPSRPERPLIVPANEHVRDMAVNWIEDPPGVTADKAIVDHEKPARF